MQLLSYENDWDIKNANHYLKKQTYKCIVENFYFTVGVYIQ